MVQPLDLGATSVTRCRSRRYVCNPRRMQKHLRRPALQPPRRPAGAGEGRVDGGGLVLLALPRLLAGCFGPFCFLVVVVGRGGGGQRRHTMRRHSHSHSHSGPQPQATGHSHMPHQIPNTGCLCLRIQIKPPLCNAHFCGCGWSVVAVRRTCMLHVVLL
jgi:hypothetical protein